MEKDPSIHQTGPCNQEAPPNPQFLESPELELGFRRKMRRVQNISQS
jgi:hypothetical protein